ncbi:MAG TPA: DUF4160 domain-containing protein [Terriglobales bacterium]|nr:DUF4160 domain-containing protein [Terriglobales bacterium]
MPTVLLSGPYRFYFFSSEPNEPPHLHVRRENLRAKFWLDPIELARNWGFPMHELRRIREIVEDNREALLETWNGYFGSCGR